MSAEGDHLGRLFRCERFVGLFPLGMPVRACLRRQLDRLVTLDGKGKPRPPADWAAAKPYCAGECALGREHLEAARAAAIPAETCLRCGSAQVGSGSAAPCAGCEPDAKAVPRGHLPPPATLVSERIWTDEVPDVPFSAPGAHRGGSPSAGLLERREARAAERRQAFEQEQDHQVEPADPAEEDDTMAKDQDGKTCRKCGKKLRSDNTRGVCGSRCKAPGGAAAGGVKEPRVEKVTNLRPAAPRRAAAPASDLAGSTTKELLERRTAIDEELRRRLAEAQDEIVALKAAVGGG